MPSLLQRLIAKCPKLPSREELQENRYLRWMGPRLFAPHLWHFGRRTVAVGVAIGMFCGVIIPFAQSLLAAAIALVFRGNLPIAMTVTFITNPFTTLPIYYMCHQVGAALLPGEHANFPDINSFNDLLHATAMLGKPLIFGTIVVSIVFGVIGYFATHRVWIWKTNLRWRRRKAV